MIEKVFVIDKHFPVPNDITDWNDYRFMFIIMQKKSASHN